MTAKIITEDVLPFLIEDYESLKSKEYMCGKYGVAWQTIKNIMCTNKITRPVIGYGEVNDLTDIDSTVTSDTMKLVLDSPTIKTVEDALDYAQVDLKIWEVTSCRIKTGHWDVTIKNGENQAERHRNRKHHVEIHLKRKVSMMAEDAINTLIGRIKTYEPPKYAEVEHHEGKYMMELSLQDVHFGMLTWHGDSISDQDIHIAEDFYLDAIKYLLSMSRGVSRILMPFGNDFLHSNNPFALTPKRGNKLDVDGRMTKIFDVAIMAVVNAINLCRQVAPVDILWIPGNHDPETSYYLGKVLQAWFRGCQDVSINCDPHYRKYYQWGTSFIGFTHGDEEPIKELPRIFLDEFPQQWAGCNFHEIHTGHRHREKQTQFVTVDSMGSTLVRELPSLCATDNWHYIKGYVGKLRSAQGILWHEKYGVSAVYPAYVKEE